MKNQSLVTVPLCLLLKEASIKYMIYSHPWIQAQKVTFNVRYLK